MKRFRIKEFISSNITFRKSSMFDFDMTNNFDNLFSEIKGKKCLIIGGAGTIGSNFIKQLLKFNPSHVVVVDINENGLTELTRDLRSSSSFKVPKSYYTYPFDFSDNIFYEMMKHHGPFEIVANFAAHKHVRSEKDRFSISAMIKNNILHSKKLLDFLSETPPNHFFCVSTDKAVAPVNIMGASKKVMENLIFNYSDKFKVTTARFANVAFSNGSLLDGFINRFNKLQPFSSPKNILRYFVSPEESGQICLLACILGNTKDIFFPKLDKSKLYPFYKISNSYLKFFGFDPILHNSEEEAKQANILELMNSNKYPVFYFDSKTTGEKMKEEFFTENEKVNFNIFNSLAVIKSESEDNTNFLKYIFELENAVNNVASKEKFIEILKKLLGNFDHIEKGKNLDEIM